MTLLMEPQKQVAARDGWSRGWRSGGPHYFVQGATHALCGSPAGLLRGDPVTDHPLTLTPEPDGELNERQRKSGCPHCMKKVRLMTRGRR